ncbi:hypothetical protein [Halalkalibacter hemicellulosilyticus]|uniref:Uncharacterized protein n=1 Tax=Halalkalibacter hemicellulosilyticusJCM 9152 TaxID=1236971 RepID=W4QKF4_9BACI|nr:hypothetical protein [Halalkalibacter hemicellulosilyticus]GAE32561.1 hypothetical protein JCM9152_4098 [Halalkalibacter hemicellulosilyticusJCM 9152]
MNGEVIHVRDGQETIETNVIQLYSGDMIVTNEDSAAKAEMDSSEVFVIGENSSVEMERIIDDESKSVCVCCLNGDPMKI